MGVIGCGLIAQVVHLAYLTELADRVGLAARWDRRSAAVQLPFGAPVERPTAVAAMAERS